MKELRKTKEQNTRSLSPDMKVNDIIRLWPQTLNTFIKMGFGPLQNKMLRNTIARNVTLKQAANFRNIDLNILLLNLQTSITNPTSHSEAFIDPDRLRFDEDTIPNLEGDINVLGLVPCPIRNILIEKFDAYLQENYSSKGKKVAWWLAAEGSGLGDVKNYLISLVKSKQYETFPDFFLAVGTELFLHEEYCRKLYVESVFKPVGPMKNRRPEFHKLEDPNGKLQLQFAVLFSFFIQQDSLGKLPIPQTWFDLTDPKYKGHVVIPALNLPIIPDFLSALYYYLGDLLFIKFCQNVSFAQHPAQSSKRRSKHRNPGIYITPLHFSKIMKSKDSVHILPRDGFVTVPAYITQSVEVNDDNKDLRNYLFSKEFLNPYYQFGSFIPNHNDIAVDVPLDNLITRPWTSVFDNIPDRFIEQLLRNFKLEITS